MQGARGAASDFMQRGEIETLAGRALSIAQPRMEAPPRRRARAFRRERCRLEACAKALRFAQLPSKKVLVLFCPNGRVNRGDSTAAARGGIARGQSITAGCRVVRENRD